MPQLSTDLMGSNNQNCHVLYWQVVATQNIMNISRDIIAMHSNLHWISLYASLKQNIGCYFFFSYLCRFLLHILAKCLCRKCWKQKKNAYSFILSSLKENFPNTNLNSCWLDVILIRHFYDFFVAPPDNWVTQLHIYAHQATKLKRYQIPTKNQWKTPKYGAFISVLTLNK